MYSTLHDPDSCTTFSARSHLASHDVLVQLYSYPGRGQYLNISKRTMWPSLATAASMRIRLTSVVVHLVFAIGLLVPATTARHFDVTRFRDNACRTKSIDQPLVHHSKSGGMALKRHGECYPYAGEIQGKKKPSVIMAANGSVDDEVFRSISWRWSDTGLAAWHRKKVDMYWNNCTLFVYELENCDESGRVNASWYVDKWGMQNRCWGLGDGPGARSLKFDCIGN
nr:hypothetical protein CFP56_46793 [Quercus suber]